MQVSSSFKNTIWLRWWRFFMLEHPHTLIFILGLVERAVYLTTIHDSPSLIRNRVIISEVGPMFKQQREHAWNARGLLKEIKDSRLRPRDPCATRSSLVWITHTDAILVNGSHPDWYPAGQRTRDVYPMMVQCWPTVYDAGPTLNQHWFNVTCLLGMRTYRPDTRSILP